MVYYSHHMPHVDISNGTPKGVFFASSMHQFAVQTISRISGFTLLEVLVTVTVIGLLAGFAAPVYQSFQVRADVDIAALSTVHNLRRAQSLAMASAGDSTWGVRVGPGSIVVFQGESYASRDAQFDEVTAINTALTLGGMTEVVFSKVSGLPVSTGIISFSARERTLTVTINSHGMVSQ